MGARPGLVAVGGAFAIAFSGILVRLADVEPSTAAFFRCLYALPFLLPLALRERRLYGPREAGQARLAWIAGIFFAADLVFWHHAIGAVGAGLATVLANTQVVLVGVAAWLLLGEKPGARLAASVPVVLVGIVLISGVVGADAYGDDPALGVVLGLLTAVSYSAFLLVLRAGNRDIRRPAGPLLDATAASAAASVVIGLALGELDLAPTWPEHAWLVLLAVSAQVVGWLAISVSLPRLDAAVTSVLLTLQPVGTVVLAVLLLAERPSWVQLAGIAVLLAGVTLATGRRKAQAPPVPT
ncbi:MAG TPA: DMT family transporter [Gaiellaceae bacterium]|nr:DMT family transporter [Gaiellaceae bacterium]